MTMRFKLAAVGLCGLAVLAVGCKGRQAPGPRLLERRLEALEGQTASIQSKLNRMAEERREREKMARRLEAVEGQLERIAKHPSPSAVGENPLEALPRPSEVSGSLAQRRPPPDLPLPQPPPPREEPPAAPSPSRPRSPVSVRERTAEELFRLGRRHFEAGELSSTVERLRLYLERSPDMRRADEALFLIGRSELARGRPFAAAQSFRRLAEGFPQSPMRPEALYHGGEAFRRLNDKVQALKLWRELEDRYPSHPLAEKAREAVRRMAQER